LKSYDDLYDFNASTHRGIIGETLTKIGASTSGKPYWIEIRGPKEAKQNGTFSTPAKSTSHQSPWYYY
jgi:hypothetical protein